MFCQHIVGPPVDKKKVEAVSETKPQKNETTEDPNLGVEYQKYLKEIVEVLENDKDFRKKLDNATAEEIRDGTIAKELEFLDHGVRSKLDEIKRQEIERLRHAIKMATKTEGFDRKHLKIPEHLDIKQKKFEQDDLKKLIKKTSEDLEEADKKRREEFKRYEMEKKFEKQRYLKSINDTDLRKEAQEEMEKNEAKHRQHDKLKHPMTKEQLEEVWEEQDHMDKRDFNPKTFFKMHDLDGNGFLDRNEIKAMFKAELDKAYDRNAPEDDMREREEEMERMREHVFKEADEDGDNMISEDEFMKETSRKEYEHEGEEEPEWDPDEDLDRDDYTSDEYDEFYKDRMQELEDEDGHMATLDYDFPGMPMDPKFKVPPPTEPVQHGEQPENK